MIIKQLLSTYQKFVFCTVTLSVHTVSFPIESQFEQVS